MKIKITEDQFNEFIDMNGSIIDGGRKEDDSEIRTNYYRKTKRPQTSEDFADSTGQRMKWYHYRGFSVTEGKVNEEEFKENIVKKQKDSNIISRQVDVIPSSTELSKSYEQNELQNNLDGLSRQLTTLGLPEEQENDIKAIVLKQILSIVEVSSLSPAQQEEIKSMIR